MVANSKQILYLIIRKNEIVKVDNIAQWPRWVVISPTRRHLVLFSVQYIISVHIFIQQFAKIGICTLTQLEFYFFLFKIFLLSIWIVHSLFF